jgi:serine/threonine protein kinase
MIVQTILHYKILEKLGEGGMGIVYKAQDTKLDRFVALKFLPSHTTVNSETKIRFEQEAKAAASLNHPNICTIYGIDEAEAKHFIVMEFVDGQTLQKKKNTLSQKQALDIGIQIADGLAAAHEKGIVHRDIKPENIMIRKDGIVQIMDFGLAKLRGTSRLTKEGSTVGTAGYMSPEQVQGQETDHRSDIFSLGVLLYEMFTGQIPFKGVHETAIAYEIVNVDSPPMSSVQPDITPELDAIILECLEKDPKERSQSASQVAVDLKKCRRESSRQRASRMTAAQPARTSSKLQFPSISEELSPQHGMSIKHFHPWMITGAIAVIMLLVGYGISMLTRGSVILAPVVHASLGMPAGIRYADGLGGHSTISPDGSMIVFAATDSLAHSNLWILQLKSNEATALAATEHAQYPFWSYDSKSIGFFADGKLKTIDAKGGPVLELADAPFGRGGAWSSDGQIMYSPSVSDPNLYAVPSSGGTPHAITTFDSTSKYAPRFPSFLSDGKHFIFTMLELKGAGTNADVYIGSTENHETKKILSGCSYGRFASGYLFYLRQGILIAQPFDPGSGALSGKPISLQGNINSWAPRAKADFSVSENGVVVYAVSGSARTNELFWIASDGTESVISQCEYYTKIALSPDESMIAYDRLDKKNTLPNVWMYDLTRKVNTRLTFGLYGGNHPCWSRDGKRIYYNAEVGGSKANIFVKQSDGSGEERLIVRDTAGASVGYYPDDVSPDGRFLLINVRNESGSELATVDLTEPRMPFTLVKLGLEGGNGLFSLDGKWILYQSKATEASVSSKIYISTFKGNAGTWQLPIESGNWPHWGREIIDYYSTAHDQYERCDIAFSSGTPVFGESKPLFSGKVSHSGVIFAVTKKGNRYLAVRPANAGAASTLSVIVNWKGLADSK